MTDYNNIFTNDETMLFMLLDKFRDPKCYSYSLNSIEKTLNTDRKGIYEIGESLREKLGDDYKVNIFDWIDNTSGKKYTFVGFEYRRKDYEHDKVRGINNIEKNIKRGVYS